MLCANFLSIQFVENSAKIRYKDNTELMRLLPPTVALICAILLLALTACNIGDTESGEHSEESRSAEHTRESESEEHSEESESGEDGEESGTQYALGETFDDVRAGMRLVIAYDSTSNAFTGTVENTTGTTLSRVRVEVHLSNGIELGPTTPVDLAPGQVVDVNLPASREPFESWNAHPEAG